MLTIKNAVFRSFKKGPGGYKVLVARYRNKGFEGRLISISKGTINEGSLVKIYGHLPDPDTKKEAKKSTAVVRIFCLKNCCEIIRRLKEVL